MNPFVQSDEYALLPSDPLSALSVVGVVAVTIMCGMTSGRATVLLDCHTMSSRFSAFGEPLEFLLVDRENP